MSARAISASARRAGYAPLAADLFGDLDLRATAEATVRIYGDFEHGMRRQPVLDALEMLAEGRDPAGVVCGTGFEDRPALLDAIAERWPLLGNSPAAVARAKDPQELAAICRRLEIPHPAVSEARPAGAGWISKRRGGAGGAHVATGDAADSGTYWQWRVDGDPVAALVLGDGASALVLGFSTQWTDSTPTAPFRYGGAVRSAVLASALKAHLAQAARDVAEVLGLVGLNSVDFLVGPTGWNLIDVNPRPGATLDIFEPSGAAPLFALHVASCHGELPLAPPSFRGAAAACTVYARRDVESIAAIAWPDWTADRQAPGTTVAAGAPLCTVLARADMPAEARRLVGERGEAILAELGAS